jgi:WD40-like Beta Propeller Repeat
VLASRLAPETVNNLASNIARALLALYFSALIVASVARAQYYAETLLSTDNAYNPIPSPDGRYIAYVRTGWGEKSWIGFGRASLVSDVKIVTVKGDGAPRTLANDYFLSAWTPDSTRVVCYRDWNYALVSTEGKQTMAGRIPNDPDRSDIAAEWVAYSPSLETIIWSRQVDKSHRSIETPTRTIVKHRMFWKERVVPSPDGRYLVVFREESQTDLRVYDLRLKSWTDLGRTSIHPDKDWWYIQPNWSPWFADSSRLVFVRDSTLVITSPDGTQNTETKVDGYAGLPVASPDGQSIAYVTFEPRPMKERADLQFWGGTTIWVVPTSAGSTPHPVTQKNQDEVYDLKWLSNDTLVFDRVADEGFYGRTRIWKAAVPR